MNEKRNIRKLLVSCPCFIALVCISIVSWTCPLSENYCSIFVFPGLFTYCVSSSFISEQRLPQTLIHEYKFTTTPNRFPLYSVGCAFRNSTGSLHVCFRIMAMLQLPANFKQFWRKATFNDQNGGNHETTIVVRVHGFAEDCRANVDLVWELRGMLDLVIADRKGIHRTIDVAFPSWQKRAESLGLEIEDNLRFPLKSAKKRGLDDDRTAFEYECSTTMYLLVVSGFATHEYKRIRHPAQAFLGAMFENVLDSDTAIALLRADVPEAVIDARAGTDGYDDITKNACNKKLNDIVILPLAPQAALAMQLFTLYELGKAGCGT